MRQKLLAKYLGIGTTQRSKRLLLAIASFLGATLYNTIASANPVPLNDNNEQPEAIAWELPSETTQFALPFTSPTAEALQVEERSFNTFFRAQEAIVAQEPTSTDSDLETLRNQYLLPEPATLVVPTAGGSSAPGVSIGTPTAFGANWGRVYTGFGYQERTRYTTKADGTLALGFGLGNSRENVGLEVSLVVTDLIDETLADGGVSFKVHRLLPNNFAVAAGVEYALSWGDIDTTSSPYGVVTKIFRFKENSAEPLSQLTVSLGVGGGRYRSEDDVINDNNTIGVFSSVGLRVVEQISLIADWTGQDLFLGASIVPFKDLPLVITPAFADITNNAGDGARFILGIGYGYTLAF
ncbi:hypothetical protein [Oscillatoria acuminata]|uniref:Uncharacterized protein n=1 Tax=Oscillatoria acuminata PCC 6304 TaxID=56110 RepID=K9TTD8_9CYAN|nr:hypothetical protein [Oscillatoria acuminata]AFY85259.1 hypothetical protein Oscil6304_5788 [Oscillatoria acuminata PCC 6304]